MSKRELSLCEVRGKLTTIPREQLLNVLKTIRSKESECVFPTMGLMVTKLHSRRDDLCVNALRAPKKPL